MEASFAPGRCATDGDTTPLVENARWLPYYVAHGTADELFPVTGTFTQIGEFDHLGYRYRFEHYLGQAHVPWYLQDAWSGAARHMGTVARRTDPGHVTYRWHPHLDRPEWGLRATGAYWIGDVTARRSGPGSEARIEANSWAQPDPTTTPVRTRGVTVPGETTPPVVSEMTCSPGAAPPRRPSITLELRNVAALRLDLIRAGFARSEAGRLAVRRDGVASVTLAGVHAGSTIRLDGVALGRAASDDTFAVRIPAGTHEVTVGGAGTAPPSSPTK